MPHHPNHLWFLPDTPGALPPRPWPTLVFLHGIGERGGPHELGRVARWGLPKLRRQGWSWSAGGFPFLLVAPQCPAEHRWEDDATLILLDRLLDALVTSGSADPDRLVITGFSMGGIGTFALALRHPHRFAAIVPVCGRCPAPADLPRLAHLPIWVAYAEDDEIAELTAGACEAIARLAPFGRLESRAYRLGPAGDESAHVRTADHAYRDPALYAWLSRQRRSPPRPLSAQTSRNGGS